MEKLEHSDVLPFAVATVNLSDLLDTHKNNIRERFKQAIASYDGSGYIRVDPTDMHTDLFDEIAEEFNTKTVTLSRSYRTNYCAKQMNRGISLEDGTTNCGECKSCLYAKHVHYSLICGTPTRRSSSKKSTTKDTECKTCHDAKVQHRLRLFRATKHMISVYPVFLTVVLVIILVSLFVDFTPLSDLGKAYIIFGTSFVLCILHGLACIHAMEFRHAMFKLEDETEFFV